MRVEKEKALQDARRALLLASIKNLEEVIWNGVAFPELHEVTAKAITDLSETLQLGGVLQEFAEDLDNLEFLWEPPMKARFEHLSFPGMNLRPYIVYEAGLL